MGAILAAAGIASPLGCTSENDPKCACPCKERGLCDTKWNQCRALRDESCQKSEACELLGQCHAAEGKCMVKTDEDCAGSMPCRTAGLCVASNNRCVKK